MKPESLSHFAQYPSLKGRSVFVTGGSSGIGGDIVIAFARQGAQVALPAAMQRRPNKSLMQRKRSGPNPCFCRVMRLTWML